MGAIWEQYGSYTFGVLGVLGSNDPIIDPSTPSDGDMFSNHQ